MMKPDHFGPFLTLIRLGFSILLVGFVYLLFGDFLPTWPQSQTTMPVSIKEQGTAVATTKEDVVENGIHIATGLVYAEGFELVRAQCTACHSAKLVTQNRASRDGWRQMIRWMQSTQGLWDLGDKEKSILDYLSKYYAPEEVGRRANLDITATEWYILEL